MKTQYRIIKTFINDNDSLSHLVEVCYLAWMANPGEDPQLEEQRDVTSVTWKYIGTLLIPDSEWKSLVQEGITFYTAE